MQRRMKLSITTKTGDRGTTRLFSGEDVPKNSPRMDALGAVDELVSLLGVARCHAARPATRAALLEIQRELFTLASEFATTPAALPRLPRRVDAGFVAAMERRGRELEASVEYPAGFILPGASLAGAHLDHARAVARRCEREAVRLRDAGLLENPQALIWLNRLSDVLWLLARSEEERPQPLRDPAP